MFYAAGRVVVRPLAHLVYRPTVSGRHHVPAKGGLVLASNHLSFIDSFVIPLVAARKVAFLAKSDYFVGRSPLQLARRAFFDSVGAIPVRRGSPRAAHESLEIALDILEQGGAFGIYPEGTRSRDGRLYRGRTGVAWLALNAGVPVVPVGLTGTERVQPVGTHRLRLAPVTVRFGPPIGPDAYAALPPGRARRAMTDDVMDAIAGLTGQRRAAEYNDPRPGETGDR